MRFEYLIGLRYLRARRKERFVSLIALISLAGVMLGTFTLTVDLAVMSGFEEDLHQRLLAFTPHITVQAPAGRMQIPPALSRQIGALAGVKALSPYISGQVLLASGGRRDTPGYVKSGAVMRAVSPDNPLLAAMKRSLTANALSALSRDYSVVIHEPTGDRQVNLPGLIVGSDLAADLEVGIGDVITVIAPTSFGVAAGVPRLRRFVVGGFFHSGMEQYDSSMLFVGLEAAQALVGDSPQFARGVEVQVEQIFAAPQIAARIARLAGPAYEVSDWTQSNVGLFAGLKLETFTHFLVLMLIVLVAAFNIVATLVMVVMERRKEIAIIRALGASANSIAKIFLFEGCLLGVGGTVLGVGLGFVTSYLIGTYHIIHLPPEVFMVSAVPARLYPANFLLVGMAGIVLCLAAACYPAFQARALSPVEVIRYE